MKLYQNIATINGLTKEFKDKLGSFKKYELLSENEIRKIVELTRNEKIGQFVKSLIWDNELEVLEIKTLIDLLNLKRMFKYSLDGKDYYAILPSDRAISEGKLNHLNSLLLKLGIAYLEYKDAPIEEMKEKKERFLSLRHRLNLAIETNIFSKEFKNMYKIKMNGVTGVCLTGNVSMNGIEIPEWYANKHKIKIGDIGIAYRDPVQKLIIALKVEKFTFNTMRVHSKVFTWLAGDHDGDKIQFVPFKVLIRENKEYINDLTHLLNLRRNIFDILPSNLLKKNNFPMLMEECDKDFNFNLDTPRTVVDLIKESPKSMKYAGEINEQDYLDNQASTILNMRTVKEGTAFAGAFANWIFNACKNLPARPNLEFARVIGDKIQQEALDSKHTVGGKGFMDSKWYKITALKGNCYRDPYNIILDKINKIMDEEENSTPVADDYNDDFID